MDAHVPANAWSRVPAWTGWLRYGVLAALVLALLYALGEKHPLFFCRVCPAGALEASAPNMTWQWLAGQTILWPGPLKVAVLAAVLAGARVVWRPWCRLLCPLGALYALCNRFSFVFLRLPPERCAGCTECRSLCRGGGPPPDRVDSLLCPRCLECRHCHSITVETAWPGPMGGDAGSKGSAS